MEQETFVKKQLTAYFGSSDFVPMLLTGINLGNSVSIYAPLSSTSCPRIYACWVYGILRRGFRLRQLAIRRCVSYDAG